MKHRITKITVKTKEIISLSRNRTDEIQNSVCPICHAPLTPHLPNNSAETLLEKESESAIKLLNNIIEQK